MAESRPEKVARINEKDIISELPRNIQETILDFLPIRDAVRTSILSRKWRYRWTMIPHLLFGYNFLDSMKDKLRHYDDPKFKAYEFVSVVNGVLLHHTGPIHKLSFGILEDFDMQIVSNYINQWIPLLSMKGVRQLALDNWQITSTYYDFFAHHFSSLELTHLRLQHAKFHSAPAFGGFAYLTTLKLLRVIDYTQSIVACPVLEKLTLIYCLGLSHTNFHAPNLKCLHQKSSQITLAGLENLTEFSLGFSKPVLPQANTSNVVKVVGHLHKIEKFSVGNHCIRYLAAGGSPNRLSEPLHYLKNLKISYARFTDLSELLCILCLIRSAPNLCQLNISALGTNTAAEETLENYRIQDSEDCMFSKLEIVTFSYFKGCRAELELIKFVLAHSPSLKIMFIHRSAHLKLDAVVRIGEEMMQFSRVSPRAQIRHVKHPIDEENIW